MKKYILMAAAVLAMAVSCNKNDAATKNAIDDIVLTDGKISYSVNIAAPNGYETAVISKSEVEAYIKDFGEDTPENCACNAMYNTKTTLKDTKVEKTRTDLFYYIFGGNKINTAETYYIGVAALDENGEFKNENAIIITYPEAK